MTWRTFRILAFAVNAIVFLPLWYIWISGGVVDEITSFLSRLFMSALASAMLTGLLLIIIHLTLFGLAKWRGELPKSDGVARFVAILMLVLALVGGSGFGIIAMGGEIAEPFSSIAGVCLFLLIFMLITGRWVVVLKDILAFRSIRKSN